MLQQLTNIPEWPVCDVVIQAYEFSRPEKKKNKKNKEVSILQLFSPRKYSGRYKVGGFACLTQV